MVQVEQFRDYYALKGQAVLGLVDQNLQKVVPEEQYQKIKSALANSRESIKDIAASGLIQETSNFASMFVQAGIGLAAIAPLHLIPPEYHKLIIVDALILAYSVGPLLQAEALKQTGKTNSIIAAGINKGVDAVFHNPDLAAWSGIMASTLIGWTIDQMRNPINGAALALAVLLPHLPIASADLLGVITAGSIATISSNLLLLKNSK